MGKWKKKKKNTQIKEGKQWISLYSTNEARKGEQEREDNKVGEAENPPRRKELSRNNLDFCMLRFSYRSSLELVFTPYSWQTFHRHSRYQTLTA